jgi:hypothetical protein
MFLGEGVLSLHSLNVVVVFTYADTVVFLFSMYSLMVSIPAACVSLLLGYFYVPSSNIFICFPITNLAQQRWKLFNLLMMDFPIAQLSDPYKSML